MKLFSNAKINFGLHLLKKRRDGFHTIETLVAPVSLVDTLEIEPSRDLQISSSGFRITGKMEENLCIKAFYLLKKHHRIPNVKMQLLKNIPPGSGLGGGSSNAVAVLKALDQLFQLNLSKNDFQNYAGSLGSDCTFFIENKTAFVQGRGEIVQSFPLPLHDLELLIIWPGFSISTSAAFAEMTDLPVHKSLKKLLSLPMKDWQEQIKNDFENVVFKKYPELQQIQELLLSHGAIYSSLSGSGSAVYAFFKEGTVPAIPWPESYFVRQERVVEQVF